jgi:hypothetical protein
MLRLRSGVLTPVCSAVLVVSIGAWTSAAATVPSQKVSPKEWARSMCPSLSAWVDQAKQGDSVGTTLEHATDPVQIKDLILSFSQGTLDATDQLVRTLDAAGVPNVKKGDKIVKELKKAMKQTTDVFTPVRDTAQNLDPNDPTQFTNSLADLGNSIIKGAKKISSTFDSLDRKYPAKALDRAFSSESACKSLR